MQQPVEQRPTFESFDQTAEHSALSKVPLAIAVAAIAAAAGGWLNSVMATIIHLYFPLVPGILVGYAISKLCKTNSNVIAAIAAVFGFIGAVFGESLIYLHEPGILDYMLHFYNNALTVDWIFRGINVLIAFYWSKESARKFHSYPQVSHALVCPQCGRGNLANARFCSHCGAQFS